MIASQTRQATPQRAGGVSVQPKQGRITLSSVKKGKVTTPPRLLVYGMEGVGKSTFAAGAPDPVFLCSESGTNFLDIARFPTPETWEDVLDVVRVLTEEDHPYQTLVIDTVDWLEPLVWEYVVRNATPGKDGTRPHSIEDVGGGFGKGYLVALDQWMILLSQLERMVSLRKMGIVFVAHTHVRSFVNPEGADFDRYELKLDKKLSGKLREWADDVMFAMFVSLTASEGRRKTARNTTSFRELRTERCMAYDAKSRCGLPNPLMMDWDEYSNARSVGMAPSVGDIIAEIRAIAEEIGSDCSAGLEWAGNDPNRLVRLRNKVRSAVDAARLKAEQASEKGM